MGTGNGELHHREKLLALRARLVGDMNQMADGALNKERLQVIRMPTDMAEIGTESFEQELTLNLLGSEKVVLEQIEAALKRIEEGTFGRCEECGAGIPKARLEAIPYAALCVKCASREEKQKP